MGVGTGSSGVNSGLEYKEKNKTAANNNVVLNLSIIFSPFSYDFLKKFSNWNFYPTIYFDKYVYLRFMSRMIWNSKSPLVPVGPQEITIDDVPANVRLEGPNLDQLVTVFDKSMFIDCTSKEDGKDIVHLDWDAMVAYLSFAISEIKDILFRGHKNGCCGKVKFTVTGYEPLEPLIQAFCYLIGSDINYKSSFTYSKLCKTLKKEPWFGNFSEWLKRYNWTPELEECALFEGSFYGASEETISSRALKVKKLFQEEEKKVRPFWKEGNGMNGQVFLEDDWNITWKENGGATTDLYAHGPDKPIYHFDHPKYKGAVHNGKGMTEVKFFKDEEPLGCVNGKFYTRRELLEAMEQLDEMMNADQMGPKAWVSRAPRGGKALQTEDSLDIYADSMQKDLDAWMENTYNPQKKEYQAQIDTIDSRHRGKGNYNATEREIWERKAVEDEEVSDRWSAGIDDIPYHGKTVNRSYFKKEIDKLEKEREAREEAISKCKSNARLIRALKVISCIQFVLGMVSLTVAAPLAIKALLIIDTTMETCKMVAQFVVLDDYTIGDAFREHLLTYLSNGVSGLLMHSAFKVYTKAEKNTVSSMYAVPGAKSPKPNPAMSYEAPGKAPKITGQGTGSPYLAGQHTTFPSTPQVFKPSGTVKFFPKLPKSFNDWLGNIRYATKAGGKKGVFHFLGSAAQAGTFIYTAYSAYSNALFVFNRTELSQEDAKKLGIDKVDALDRTEVFGEVRKEAVQPVPTSNGMEVDDAIQEILKESGIGIK